MLIKGVKDEESFIEAWDKYVAPSLDAKSGVCKCGPRPAVAGAGGDKQSPPAPNLRKRTAEQGGGQPPALLPTKKVCPKKVVESGTMDEEIRKAFVGIIRNTIRGWQVAFIIIKILIQ